jgi:hypothetical protein
VGLPGWAGRGAVGLPGHLVLARVGLVLGANLVLVLVPVSVSSFLLLRFCPCPGPALGPWYQHQAPGRALGLLAFGCFVLCALLPWVALAPFPFGP